MKSKLFGWLLMCALAGAACRQTPVTADSYGGDTQNPAVANQLRSRRVEIEVSERLKDCQSASIPERFDRAVVSVPELTEPAPGTIYVDPVFKTCILRVTDREHDLAPDDPSGGLKNEYSRVQSFNADGTYLLARSTDARWYLYDARTFLPLRELPLGVDPRWHPRDPERVYFFEETALKSYDLSDDSIESVHDFQRDFPDQELEAVWTRYEGSPSLDGRFWGLMAQNRDWEVTALLIFDLEQDRVVAVRELAGQPEIDSVTISPSGDYLLVYHDEVCTQEPPEGDFGCGLMVYDRSLNEARNLLPVIGHSDTALDAAGREVLVFQDVQKDQIAMLDLVSGVVTALIDIDFTHSPLGFHFSGRAFQNPGWALVSTYSGAQPSATWMDDLVFAMELKPGGRVIRLAHTHSVVDESVEKDYWAEPQASVDPFFTRVVFTSNWGRSGTDEVDMFAILLPSDLFTE